MKGFMRTLVTGIMMICLASCSGKQSYSDDDLALDDSTVSAEGGGGDEISDFDDAGSADLTEDEAVASQGGAAPADSGAAPAAGGDELSLDEPTSEPPPAVAENPTPAPTPEPALPAETPPAPEAAMTPEPTPEPVAPTPEPEPTPAPAPVHHASSSSGGATITSVKYKANDNGGTVVIEANGPISYTTRTNPELNQLIVEVPDSILPRKLQRPLNTRDIQGSIGAIDPYQNAGSNVSRFVIQLRPGASEPAVQQEGNTLLVVANALQAAESSADSKSDLTRGETQVNVDMNTDGILASQSLSDFLAGNTKFYGKKISIEMNNMDVRDALRFITEESGVNMVIAEEVRGNVSLKLRQVPWDQALVVLMRAKRLGYTRQGNVLRIATQDQLKQEEDDATKLAQSKRSVESLKVRMFPISYAQVVDLEKRVSGFLSERGKVVGDVRTNSLVVTDIEDNLQRVAKLIQSLDTQPPQVLIEGKIVEATEDFTRAVGINWGFNGNENFVTTNKSGPVNLTPTLSINPVAKSSGQAFNFDLTMGTLDRLGDLTAALALNEKESKVKVLSSPRIVTLTNETANISQTTEIPVPQAVPVGNSSSPPLQTVTFKPLTLRLEVTPQITSDASIIMKVNVKREFPGSVTSGQAPTYSREANTRVLVPNGQTTVIGGIYQNDVAEGETGVPYLRSIPFLGALFRGRETRKNKSELLIFLTPRILSKMEGKAPATGDL